MNGSVGQCCAWRKQLWGGKIRKMKASCPFVTVFKLCSVLPGSPFCGQFTSVHSCEIYMAQGSLSLLVRLLQVDVLTDLFHALGANTFDRV